MIVAAIDPGYLQSAFIVFDGLHVVAHRTEANDQILERLEETKVIPGVVLVLEEVQMFASHGVGKEVFDSVFWTGRFVQAWVPKRWDRMIRSKVRAHLCHTMKSGDPQVRAALIDRFGPFKEKAIGNKSAQGPLFGLVGHEWQALGLAVTYLDQHGHEDPIRPGVNAEF